MGVAFLIYTVSKTRHSSLIATYRWLTIFAITPIQATRGHSFSSALTGQLTHLVLAEICERLQRYDHGNTQQQHSH